MTDRNHLAMQAMQVILANFYATGRSIGRHNTATVASLANESYQMADAMIKASELPIPQGTERCQKKIKELTLSWRVVSILNSAGFYEVNDLIQLTRDQVSRIYAIGKVAMDELDFALHEEKLSFKEATK